MKPSMARTTELKYDCMRSNYKNGAQLEIGITFWEMKASENK